MDQSRFQRYVACYKDTVYRVAYNFFGNTYDADDMVQDVFCKLFTASKRFESDEHVRNWLIRVTINLCKNTLSSARITRNEPLDDDIDDRAAQPTFSSIEQADLFDAVMSLPERYRTVLNLFYYEDLPVKSIAKLLNLSESAVTTRLSRARGYLKNKLAEVWSDE